MIYGEVELYTDFANRSSFVSKPRHNRTGLVKFCYWKGFAVGYFKRPATKAKL